MSPNHLHVEPIDDLRKTLVQLTDIYGKYEEVCIRESKVELRIWVGQIAMYRNGMINELNKEI